MSFDWWMLPVTVFLYAAVSWLRNKDASSYLNYSDIALFGEVSSATLQTRKKLADLFSILAFMLLLGALLDPHLSKERTITPPPPAEGAAFYLVLDRSGSMKEQMAGSSESRLDALKKVTETFITSRQTDLIGLVGFARTAQVLSPLTTDHRQLLEKLKRFHLVESREEDGTAIGYALYKTANLLQATRTFTEELEGSYKMGDAAIVLITDGFQFPHPEDRGNRLRTMGILDSAEAAAANKIKVYLINIDPEMLSDEFAPHRRLMQRAAEMTGGKFFVTADASELQNVFSEIDALEKSTVPLPESVRFSERSFSFAPILIALSLFFLLGWLWIDLRLVRRVP